MPIDTNFEDVETFVDRGVLYNGVGSHPSSPSSGIYSTHSHSLSGTSHSQGGAQIQWTIPFGTGNQPHPRIRPRRTQSSELIGPTDISEAGSRGGNFPIPPSWHVNTKSKEVSEEEEEESSDDEEDSGSVADQPWWKIRIYGPDNTDHILRVSTSHTVAALTPQLDQRLPAGEEREAHELYLKERGRERILRLNARPANILRRRLRLAGYDESDGHDLLGTAGVPFLLKFVYRSEFLGPADEELSLTHFDYIDLTRSSLTTIPVVLHQQADAIVTLILSGNPMIDIPLDFVQSCTALSKLVVSEMHMKKVPHSIRYSETLTVLDISSNRIKTLEDLPRLTTLYAQNNRLERLPENFLHLHRLEELNISNNRFHTFPVVLTELPILIHLDISFNSISELPHEIGRLSNLVSLVIVGNQISTLPEEFSDLLHLREFDCRRNQITDLGVACGLPEMESLSADHNSLHNLSLSIGPSLLTLDVSHNDITELSLGRGSLSPRPLSLTALDISNAKLSILDEAALSHLILLKSLKLDHNLLRTLPESLGDLRWLETLSCSDNFLSDLPQSIGKLQKLETLDVHSNSLRMLPVSLWNCASLLTLNATSNLLMHWHDPPPFVPEEEDVPSFPPGTLLASPKFPPRRPSVISMPDIPPLAHSLERLHLGENSLTDEMLHPLMILKELRVLNLSFNDIQEMPPRFFEHLTHLEEVFLSGNRLTHVPSEDLPQLTQLSTMFLNGNHLQHLPHELGQVKSLTLLDVGNNVLNYNINNVDYDWNWNFNKNLVYLNLSGNKQLQIKSDVSNYGQRSSMSSIERRTMSGFSGLPKLRVLGLMDVTITTTGTSAASDIPDESDDRRVRTSSSLVNGMLYGIADTLGKNRHPLMMDLVHEFRGIKKDAVFAMFGRCEPLKHPMGTTPTSNNSLAKFLKDNFIRVFIAHLNALNLNRTEGVPDALRRTFLKLNQEFYEACSRSTRKMSVAGGSAALDQSPLRSGASGIVVYIVGRSMYVANAGNALAIVSRRGAAHAVSRKHDPYDRAETERIRAAEGWISPPGLVNNELDISRSFGFYHLLPAVNARPDVCQYDLTDQDDMIIIANRGLWDYVEYQTAVDIAHRTEPTAAAQKLRDLAISYGAEGSTMVMVVCLANLFKEEPAASQSDRRRRPRHPVIDHTLNRLKDEVSPPTGHVTIVFTDIKASTPLWEATPSGMITAIHLHNNLLRRCLRECGGYEVRTEGDSFMCSFPTVLAAVWWSLTIQVRLLNVPWPQDILECPNGKAIYDEQGRLIYRGLSVRVGIHCGAPLCIPDPITNRMDYFGLVVTRASRIEKTAAGGQIMFSSDVLSEINARVFERGPATEYSDAQPKDAVDAIRMLVNETDVVTVGEVKLKGLEVPEMLSFLLPSALVGRRDHTEPSEPSPATVEAPVSAVRPTFHPNISVVRELAALCVRLELLTADRVLRPPPERYPGSLAAPIILDDDTNVLFPPDVELTDAETSTIMFSLMVRIENAENVLRGRSGLHVQIPPGGTTQSLAAALRDLDQRTLEEVLSMLHS
ncbi:adenylate cyclase [Mycena crocata]|nr:adenylate cyclase [Mycena crocata]